MKWMFFGIAIIVVSLKSIACDVCGGSSMSGVGLYNLNTQKYIGLSYEYGSKRYSDNVEAWSYLASNQTINVTGAWIVLKTFQLEFNLPYGVNSRIYSSEKLTNNGLADVQFGLNYFIKLKSDSLTKIILKLGISSELPTGKYVPELRSYAWQNSSKSIDGIYKVAFALQKDKFNIVAQSSFKNSFYESIDYRFGNAFLNEILLKYSITNNKKYELLPQIGFLSENKSYDIKNNFFQHGTKWNSFYSSIGLQIINKNLITGFVYSLPIYYNNDEKGITLNNRARFYTTLTF